MDSQVVSQNKVNHYEFTGWKVSSRMFLDFVLSRSGFRLATQEWVSYLSAGVSFIGGDYHYLGAQLLATS